MQSQFVEEPLKFAAAHFFVKRRRRDFADADFALDGLRLIAFGGIEGRADGGILREIGRRLCEAGQYGAEENGDSAKSHDIGQIITRPNWTRTRLLK